MGDAGESELTAKAREVLAGLSDEDRASLLSDSWLGLHAGWHETWNRLNDLDLATVSCSCWPMLTDLGHECRRLLSEVQS